MTHPVHPMIRPDRPGAAGAVVLVIPVGTC